MSFCSDHMLSGTAFAVALTAHSAAGAAGPVITIPESIRPNVLFIMVDDLRPQLGTYGHANMVTPNMDRLASEGTRFDRAYCELPACGPSRASMMTSLRPTPSRFTKRATYAEKDAPDAVPMHTHFKQHGYYTISLGKIFDRIDDHLDGWSEKPWRMGVDEIGFFDCYVLPESLEMAKESGRRGPSYEMADVPDNTYSDGILAERAMEDLRRLAREEKPFFLTVGFPRPHLPLIAPKKYWDLYDFDEIQMPENRYPPQDVPDAALRDWIGPWVEAAKRELSQYSDIPLEGPLTDEHARTLIHGYYACVSYVDALVGNLLDELKKLGLDENTIVILWGDHGYHLWEHGFWGKQTCFETSMRVPLLFRAPGMPEGVATENLVESVDIYPTLCELAGLPLPAHLEGRSFVPLLRGEDLSDIRSSAVGRMYRGETIRTDRYRYTEYFNRETGEWRARMLYDLAVDPNETVNIAEHPENSGRAEDLGRRLRTFLPPGHPLLR